MKIVTFAVVALWEMCFNKSIHRIKIVQKELHKEFEFNSKENFDVNLCKINE